MRSARKTYAFLICLAHLVAPIAESQLSSIKLPPRSVTRRDEDEVAKAFEKIRAAEHLPPLKRILRRTELEQRTCTVALQGTTKGSINPFLPTREFYKAEDLSVATPELRRVASVNRRDYTRFSIAVWPDPPGYWVGVALYWSAGSEFFENTFTDEMLYKNEWKKTIAKPCKSLQ